MAQMSYPSVICSLSFIIKTAKKLHVDKQNHYQETVWKFALCVDGVEKKRLRLSASI